MKNEKVNGFQVLVLDGREISRAEFAKLCQFDQDRVRQKANGPHHTSKWAMDLLGTNISQSEYRRRRVMTGGAK